MMDFINGFWSKILEFFTWLLNGVVHVLHVFGFWLWDHFLSIVSTCVNALDVSGLVLNQAQTWGLMPPQFVYLLNQLGLPQCFNIIAAAYLIRLTLNLIPGALSRV